MSSLTFYGWVCRMVISFGGCQNAIFVGTRSSIFGFLMRYGFQMQCVFVLCTNVVCLFGDLRLCDVSSCALLSSIIRFYVGIYVYNIQYQLHKQHILIFMVRVQVIRLGTLCNCTVCLVCVLLAALRKIRQRCILLEFPSKITFWYC